MSDKETPGFDGDMFEGPRDLSWIDINVVPYMRNRLGMSSEEAESVAAIARRVYSQPVLEELVLD